MVLTRSQFLHATRQEFAEQDENEVIDPVTWNEELKAEEEDEEAKEEEEWEVEKIMTHNQNEDGLMEYKVRWFGYPPQSDTWEPEENLENADKAIEKYWAAVGPPFQK